LDFGCCRAYNFNEGSPKTDAGTLLREPEIPAFSSLTPPLLTLLCALNGR